MRKEGSQSSKRKFVKFDRGYGFWGASTSNHCYYCFCCVFKRGNMLQFQRFWSLLQWNKKMTQRNKSYDSKHIFSLLPLIRVIFLKVRREGSNLNFDHGCKWNIWILIQVYHKQSQTKLTILMFNRFMPDNFRYHENRKMW